jgi:hypothetical protein
LIDHTPHAAKQKHCWPRNSASAEKPSTPTSGPVPPHSSPQYARPGNDLPCGNAPSHRPGLESLAEVCGSGQLGEFGAWKQYLPGERHSRRPMAYADSCARQELITPESLDSGSFSPAIHRQQDCPRSRRRAAARLRRESRCRPAHAQRQGPPRWCASGSDFPHGDGHPGRKRNLLASMMRHRFRSALPVLPPRVMRSPHAQISRICGRFSLG